jgi:hypothetical protein
MYSHRIAVINLEDFHKLECLNTRKSYKVYERRAHRGHDVENIVVPVPPCSPPFEKSDTGRECSFIGAIACVSRSGMVQSPSPVPLLECCAKVKAAENLRLGQSFIYAVHRISQPCRNHESGHTELGGDSYMDIRRQMPSPPSLQAFLRQSACPRSLSALGSLEMRPRSNRLFEKERILQHLGVEILNLSETRPRDDHFSSRVLVKSMFFACDSSSQLPIPSAIISLLLPHATGFLWLQGLHRTRPRSSNRSRGMTVTLTP